MQSWPRSWTTVEIVHNETGYNEQPDITSRFGAEVRSRRWTYMIIAISVITRTVYNEQSRLDLGARYIRFLLYDHRDVGRLNNDKSANFSWKAFS